MPMIRRLAELAPEPKVDIRGGKGPGLSVTYLQDGDMDGVMAAGRTRLEPGSSIGEHPHPRSEELYLILEGHGAGILDGEEFPVGPGDLFLVKAGHSHGLRADLAGPLVYFAVHSFQTAAQ
jgi:mannose-6-phosphate isomerase-like protein (cupin superfamily)